MMKIGVFGGTFNPIHNSHIRLAQEYGRKIGLDRLVLVPTFIPPHKKAKNLASAEDRLAMCRLATKDLPEFHVTEYEIQQQGKSYTYRTLMHIQEKYPGSELYLIMGGDMFMTVQDWRRADDLFKMATLCAAQREKGELTLLDMHKILLEETKGARCMLIDIEAMPMSSTMIREKIKNGEEVFDYLNPDVWLYIIEHKLYK